MRANPLPGSVVASDSSLEPFGKLYAALTGRTSEATGSFENAAPGTPLVVIAMRSSTDSAFLQKYYSHEQTQPIGIVVVLSIKDARIAIIRAALAAVTAAAAAAKDPGAIPSTAYFDAWNRTPKGALHFDRRLGADATPSEIRGLLGKGCDLLAINAHSDGVDASLGRAVLCPLESEGPLADDRKLRPECLEANRCHRFNQSIGQALAEPRRIKPEEMSARVLVLNSCWGVMPAGGPVHTSYSLFSALMRTEKIDCIVAPWSVIATTSEMMQPLIEAIRCGTPIGAAALAFNRSDTAKQTATRIAVFGDPCFAIRRPATEMVPEPVTAQLPDPAFAQIFFLRTVLESWGRHSNGESRERVGKAIKLYTEAEGLAARAPLPVALLPRLTKPFLELSLEFNAGISHHWIPIATAQHSEWSSPCWCCGTRTTTIVFKFRVSAVANRRVTLCDVCGVIRDESMGATQRTLRLDDRGGIYIEPKPPATGIAMVHFAHRDISRNEVIAWPRERELYAEPFVAPSHIHPRLARTTVIVFDEFDISTYVIRTLTSGSGAELGSQ
jgi:hypothetical protein